MAGVIEASIQIGLIPSNLYYNRFFNLANKPVLIKDADNQTRYATSVVQNGIVETADLKVYTKNIRGGTMSYGVDISELNKLNYDLDEATVKVRIRNEYLKHQNDLKEEQLTLQTRNDIYNKITLIVKPELEETLILSDNPDSDDFDRKLARIAFYNAYIKRRSNMELLRDESATLSVKELSLAVSESIEYLKLIGVQGMARISGDYELPAGMIILFYEFFQYVTEKSLDSLSEIYVTLCKKGERYTLNFVLKADEHEFDARWKKDEIEEFDGTVSVSDEEDGTVVALVLSEGGDK